jgi:hypothetical protein
VTRELGQDNLPPLLFCNCRSSVHTAIFFFFFFWTPCTKSSMGTVRIYFGKPISSSHYWPFGPSFGSRVPFFSFTHSRRLPFSPSSLGAIEHSAIYQHLLSIAPLLLCAQLVLNENRRPWAEPDLRITRQKNGENRGNRKKRRGRCLRGVASETESPPSFTGAHVPQ